MQKKECNDFIIEYERHDIANKMQHIEDKLEPTVNESIKDIGYVIEFINRLEKKAKDFITEVEKIVVRIDLSMDHSRICKNGSEETHRKSIYLCNNSPCETEESKEFYFMKNGDGGHKHEQKDVEINPNDHNTKNNYSNDVMKTNKNENEYLQSIKEGGQPYNLSQEDFRQKNNKYNEYNDIEVILMHDHTIHQEWSNEEPPPEPPP